MAGQALEWLRQGRVDQRGSASSAQPDTPMPVPVPVTVLRLRLRLTAMDHEPELRAQVQGMLQAFWYEIDAAALFDGFGFDSRQ